VAVHLLPSPCGGNGGRIPLGPGGGRQRLFTETIYRELGHTGTEALADVAAVAFCLLAYMGTARLAGRARELIELRSAPHMVS
jgi:hypothetical protein